MSSEPGHIEPGKPGITLRGEASEVREFDQSLGILQFLNRDPRPSFVIDLTHLPDDKLNGRIELAYTNPAFHHGRYEKQLSKLNDDIGPKYRPFKEWLLRSASNNEAPSPGTVECFGKLWLHVDLLDRWRFISILGDAQVQESLEDDLHGLEEDHLDLSGKRTPDASASIPSLVKADLPDPTEQDVVQLKEGEQPLPGIDSQSVEQSKPEMSRNVSQSTEGTSFTSQDRTGQRHSRSSSHDSVRSVAIPGLVHSELDWITHDIEMSDWARFIKTRDWSNSSLGPPKEWPLSLRALVIMMVADQSPSLILWGEPMNILYNETCVPLVGSHRLAEYGEPVGSTFGETWPVVSSFIKETWEKGTSKRFVDIPLPLNRHGFLEETFWEFTFLPIIGDDGRCVGILDRFSERTEAVLSQRRMHALQMMGINAATVDKLDDVWQVILSTLDEDKNDFPIALIYTMDGQKIDTPDGEPVKSDNDGLSDWTRSLCRLKAQVGLEKTTTEDTASEIALDDEKDVLAKACHESWDTKDLVTLEGDRLPAFLKHVAPGRGFDDTPVTKVVVSYIGSSKAPFAFLILALSPRLVFDEPFRAVVQAASRKAAEIATMIMLPEEERRNRAAYELAASSHATVASTLQKRAKVAEDNAKKFSAMAAHAPLGMFFYTPDGEPLYLNDAWYEILGIAKGEKDRMLWQKIIVPDSVPAMNEEWRQVVEDKKHANIVVQTTKGWEHVDPATNEVIQDESWISCSTIPQYDDEGNVNAVCGWIYDISHEKWTARLQKERLENAIEAKRQSENFIDMTSHEMRNPLGAIIQSADGILSMISETNVSTLSSAMSDLLEAIQENAQTIALCSAHQKTIVDDILTVSKLDGNHLTIAPDKTCPEDLVKELLRIHDSELQANKIKTGLIIHDSYKALDLDFVMLDPSRVRQVLINMFTNAIKFTAPSKKRSITIELGASKERPTKGLICPEYIGFHDKKKDSRDVSCSTPDWGNGEELFMQFSVKDTGTGISPEEMQLLFMRFSQTSPRTHIMYGGSGLGLFICRELAELQGGQVGCSSKPGVGSTFEFYVRCRRFVPSSQPTSPALAATESNPSTQPTPLTEPSSADLLANLSLNSNLAFPFPRSTSEPTTSVLITQPLVDIPPREHRTHPPIIIPPQDPAKKIKISANEGPVEDPNLYVLVVEDNLVNQKVLSTQLRRSKCTVYVANHGEEALTRLRASEFASEELFAKQARQGVPVAEPLDIVLLDIEMPVMDGLTCIKVIREMQAKGELISHVPVIATTANARDAQRQKLIAAGMDLVLAKPFKIAELMPIMQKLIAEKKADTG